MLAVRYIDNGLFSPCVLCLLSALSRRVGDLEISLLLLLTIVHE